MRRYVRILTVSLLASFLVIAQSRAQNLLLNPNFDSDLSHWIVPQSFEAAMWQAADADGSGSSGSVSLRNTYSQPAASGGGAIEQCVPVVAGKTYDFGAKVQIPGGQANTGFVQIFLSWYSDTGCGGGFLSRITQNAGATTGVWQSAAAAGVAAPAGAASGLLSLAHFKNEASGSFVTYFDDAYLRPALQQTATLTLPSVTSIHGGNGTFFHSDVWILNRSFTNSIDITLRYRCFAGESCGAGTKVVPLGPRRSVLFSDIVAATFAAPETAGALEMSWDPTKGQVTSTSRLYTPQLPSPTSGFANSALPVAAARSRAVFIGLGGSGGNFQQGFRTNVGAYNPSGSPVTITFTLHAATGAVLGSPVVRTWGPNEAFQINDIFGAAGAGGTVATDAYLVVSTDGAPVFPYAAVIDNKSGDSVWVAISDDEAP
jgi:hypothetical protein